MKKRLFQVDVTVFGGCCSADTFYMQACKQAGIHLQGYFARSSLISAYSKPLGPEDHLDVNLLSSKFQRKMLHADVSKTITSAMFNAFSESRWLMMDFLVERLALAETHSGSFFTLSAEAKAASRLNNYAPKRIISAYSRERKVLFREAWQRFHADCTTHGLADKVILNKVYLTKAIADGTQFPPEKEGLIDKRNNLLEFIYDTVENDILQENVICYPDECRVADPAHKWGLSPFHFTNAFYEHQLGILKQILSRQ